MSTLLLTKTGFDAVTHCKGAVRMARIAVVFMFLGLLARAQTTFDLSADFSLQENPHKVWQYGHSATNSLAPGQFRIDEQSDTTGIIGFWHPAANSGPGPGYYPYIAFNPTHQSQVGSKGWCARAGEVAMEASNTGQYSLVRFVAPSAGTYEPKPHTSGDRNECLRCFAAEGQSDRNTHRSASSLP